MKRILFLIAFAFAAASCLGQSSTPQTVSVTLAWDPVASTNSYAYTYKLYYGPATGVYISSISSGTNTTATITNLALGGTTFFAATTVDPTTLLESLPSNEVTFTAPGLPTPPANLHISGSVIVNVSVNVSVKK